MVLNVTTPSMNCNSSLTSDSDSAANEIINTYSQIPLTALSTRTLEQLSRSLNLTKILRSEEGYERDWRGVATLAKQKTLCDENAMSVVDPMASVIRLWCQNNAKTATFEYLERFLGFIDRWDVCDDISENLATDASNYKKEFQHKSQISKAQTEQPSISKKLNNDFGHGTDANILTKDDVLRAQQGLPPQLYDAFVLFAEDDMPYVADLLKNLEDDPSNGFKLCLKDRDLLAGISFEHVALIQLVEERCKHLIVILTDKFLESPGNKFLVDYTQALQIKHKTRKIIPLIYDENVEVPGSIKIYTHLKYNNTAFGLFYFWEKLAASIQNPNISREIKTAQYTTMPLINLNNSLPTTPTDIPQINVNGNPLMDDHDDVPKKKERTFFKKRSSLRVNSNNKLHVSGNSGATMLRTAQSCNQLNSDIYESNLPEMSGLSVSTCSGDEKKKKKWPSKLFKKVFSRSSNKLPLS